jgi:hypothetical protein
MIEEYLAELSRHLRVGPLAKRRILREVEAHLQDTVRHETAEGASSQEAERRALARLGPPQELALRFAANGRGPRLRLGAIGVAAAGACIAAVLAVVFVGNDHSLAASKFARALCGGKNAKPNCIKFAERKFRSGEWTIQCSGEMAVRISDSGLPSILQCRGGVGEGSTTTR